MKYGFFVLHELLTRYNRSKHRKGEAKVNRSIRFNFQPSLFPEYFVDGLSSQVDVINEEMKHLENQGLIFICWMERDVLINYVDANLQKIDDIHVLLGINPLQEVIQERIHFFTRLRGSLQSPWILRFIDETLRMLEKKELPAVAKDADFLDLLEKSFHGIEEKGEDVLPERFFSKRFLGGSKLFEKHIRSRLVTLYKQYAAADCSEWEEEDVLQEIGIVKSFEELQIWGDFLYGCEDKTLCFSDFPYGTTLNAETIRSGEVIRIGHQQLLIIENKSVFREYIKRKQNVDEMVIYIGGFPGPLKRRLFEQIQSWVDREKESSFTFRFWGDIDLGGFRIFHHLKSTVLPDLVPYRMDVKNFRSSMKWAESTDVNYIKALEKYRIDERFECFWLVIDEMLKHQLRLEQEAFYVSR